MSTNRIATLTIDGKTVEFPVMTGVHGNDVIDIRTLGAKTGLFTYDSGFLSTASCQSKVTFIDGDKGELLYRGYPIEQLAESCSFLEVAYLLKNGELPNATQKSKFESTIKNHTMVHEQLVKFYQGFRRDAHPMAVMVGVVGALAAFYHDAVDFNDPAERSVSFNRLVAKLPTIVAMAYKYNTGQPFMYPRNDLDYTANFMHMMFGTPCEEYKPNSVLVHALDTIFTLHADHEQNASTSTVRLAGSSGANPFACMSAGIACLWGPAHGGANEACLEMLEEIGDVSRVGEYIKRAKDKKLAPAEFTGGTFCVSNLGMMGITRFSAIINPPNSAILAVGTSVKVPVVKDGAIVIGERLALTLSCDHRVVDGALGAKFLNALRDHLENPALLLL